MILEHVSGFEYKLSMFMKYVYFGVEFHFIYFAIAMGIETSQVFQNRCCIYLFNVQLYLRHLTCGIHDILNNCPFNKLHILW